MGIQLFPEPGQAANYSGIPRGVSDRGMLYGLEGRSAPAQAPMAPMHPMQGQQPVANPMVGATPPQAPMPGLMPKTNYQPSGTVQTQSQPVPQEQAPSAADTGRQIATNTATNYAAQNVPSLFSGGAPEAPVMASGTGTGAGSGILGTNGAMLGSAGVGLAGAGTAAYYGYAANQAYQDLTSQDPEAKKRGQIEAGLLATGPFLGWASPAVKPIDRLFGSGKDEDQKHRDAVRSGLKQSGILDDAYTFELANGERYDASKDGGEPQYQVQNVDNPRTGKIVGAAQVMAGLMLGDVGKQTEDLTGTLTNMALSNAKTYSQAMENLMHNFRKFAEKSGITPEAARNKIKEWVKDGKLDQKAADAYNAALQGFIEGNPYQFTDETADAPLEAGQPGLPSPTYMFDPSSNVSGAQASKIGPAQSSGPLPGSHPPTNITPDHSGGTSTVPQGGRPALPAQSSAPMTSSEIRNLLFDPRTGQHRRLQEMLIRGSK